MKKTFKNICLLCSLLAFPFGDAISFSRTSLALKKAAINPIAFVGEGTISNPYSLNCLENFIYLHKYYSSFDNCYFKLTNNIDFSNIEWTPLGTENQPFSGTIFSDIDENKDPIYTLSNITITCNDIANVGFFGYTDNCNLYNTNVVNIAINDTNSELSEETHCGSLIGHAKDTIVQNTRVKGTITSMSDVVGGLIGCFESVDKAIKLDTCSTEVSISGTGTVGGLVGSIACGEATIANSYAKTTVTHGTTVGGFIGDISSLSNTLNVKECFSTGEFIGTGVSHSFIGKIEETINDIDMNYCYSTFNCYSSLAYPEIAKTHHCYAYGDGVYETSYFAKVSSIDEINEGFEENRSWIIQEGVLPEIDGLGSTTLLEAPEITYCNYSNALSENYYFDDCICINVSDMTWFNSLRDVLVRKDGYSKSLIKGTATLNDESGKYVLNNGDYALINNSSSGIIIVSLENFEYQENYLYCSSTGYKLNGVTVNVLLRPGTQKLTYIKASINLGVNKIYIDDPLSILKSYLTVKSYNIDDTEIGNIDPENYSLYGTLQVGQNNVIVNYNGLTTKVTFTVYPSKQVSNLSVTFTPMDHIFREGDSIETIRDYIVVRQINNDGSDAGAVNNYTLEGTFVKGETTITVKYFDLETTFKVNVLSKKIGKDEISPTELISFPIILFVLGAVVSSICFMGYLSWRQSQHLPEDKDNKFHKLFEDNTVVSPEESEKAKEPDKNETENNTQDIENKKK